MGGGEGAIKGAMIFCLEILLPSIATDPKSNP
jgi:hypothetical protein